MNLFRTQTDFSKGSVPALIISLAIPNTIAQIVNVLYSIVDRIFIGRIPENATLALTGLGVCFPIITLISAFTHLISTGGAPLFAIERGRKNDKEAGLLLGNSMTMLLGFGVILTVFFLIFQKPILLLLGASENTLPFASQYLTVYLCGSIFVMLSLGLNSFINAQGFAKYGMLTVAIGAGANLVLDPLFIFVFHMGVKGAALATVIAQFLSAGWTLLFLTGKKTEIRLTFANMKALSARRISSICKLGLSGFIMAVTNSITQFSYNACLLRYGGDIYVTVMTVINSIRELIVMPVNGISQSAQPVISYNYGAKKYDRVCKAIRFMAYILISYTVLAWLFVSLTPQFFIRIFNKDAELLACGVRALHIYFFGFCFMALQFVGQSSFTALGKSKFAIFFSIFRKIVIVVPLIYILPGVFGLGTDGIFLSEPISNVIGGSASMLTMLLTVYRDMRRKQKECDKMQANA